MFTISWSNLTGRLLPVHHLWLLGPSKVAERLVGSSRLSMAFELAAFPWLLVAIMRGVASPEVAPWLRLPRWAPLEAEASVVEVFTDATIAVVSVFEAFAASHFWVVVGCLAIGFGLHELVALSILHGRSILYTTSQFRDEF